MNDWGLFFLYIILFNPKVQLQFIFEQIVLQNYSIQYNFSVLNRVNNLPPVKETRWEGEGLLTDVASILGWSSVLGRQARWAKEASQAEKMPQL